MKTLFKDHFSKVATSYQAYRPTYPEELFNYLSSLAPSNDCAWDCATGTGQAAVNLASYFRKVLATDASEKQIAQAVPLANIEYLITPAEQTQIAAHSVDLITVAQALHWFDIEAFFKEADRVLKRSGVLAVWTYGMFKIGPSIDRQVTDFAYGTLGSFWPKERQLVESKYNEIVFPFKEEKPAAFEMRANWSMEELLAYIGTWSSVKRYRDEKEIDPVLGFRKILEKVWQPGKKIVRWPLTLKVCRKFQNS